MSRLFLNGRFHEEWIQTVSLPMLVVGAVMLHLSLYSLAIDQPLPLPVLLAGIILQSVAVTIFAIQLLANKLQSSSRGFALVFLAVLSISTAFIRLSRFGGFNGFDFVREAQVMANTANSGYWDPSLSSISTYQSSLAITILPTITSRVIQVDPQLVYLFQTFTLMALLPLAVQAAVTSLTKSFRFGTITAVLLAINWFFFGAHVIGKTAPALFLATVSVYCLVSAQKNLQSIGALLGLGVAMSHYTVGLVFVAGLVGLALWSLVLAPIVRRVKIFSGMTSPPIRLTYFVLTIGLVLVWVGFAAPTIVNEALSVTTRLFSSIGGLASGPRKVDTSLAVSNNAGPIVTGWFDLQIGLIGVGAFYWFNRYRKGEIHGGLVGWIVVGLTTSLLLLAWILLPFLSVAVESTRILALILPVVIIFMSAVLIKAFNSSRRYWKLFVVGIILLMLPMNMMLPNQDQSILYHPFGAMNLGQQISLESGASFTSIPTESNTAASVWVSKYISANTSIEVDAVGRYALTTSYPFPAHPQFVYESSPPYEFHRPSMLSYYFVYYGNWTLASLGARVTSQGDPAPFFSPTHNLVYASPKFWIVTYNQP